MGLSQWPQKSQAGSIIADTGSMTRRTRLRELGVRVTQGLNSARRLLPLTTSLRRKKRPGVSTDSTSRFRSPWRSSVATTAIWIWVCSRRGSLGAAAAKPSVPGYTAIVLRTPGERDYRKICRYPPYQITSTGSLEELRNARAAYRRDCHAG